MKALYRLTALCITVIAFSSCEKVIDLNLKASAPQLVIEGAIINVSQTPTVRISRSVGFDEPSNFPGVSGATVKITSGTTSLSLIETSPGVYQGPTFIGRLGRTYTLQVDVDGQTYKASSTMPNQTSIDSVGIEEQSFQGKIDKTVVLYYDDAPGIKNQYRFVMTVNGKLVKEVFARNDQFNDGRPVRVALYQDDIEIKTGDKIDLEMQCIDERIYTYWFTFSKQSGNGMGNASVAPTNPPNNFDKPVLGYFSAHTVNRRQISVK
ncbi:DUF4249 domain-containing protein [Mucilaginibacter calamicampi]|uniref:DUF4249 domain-containing protein n=1 Tax=Mucilaginibacter calamicampi TaxID=1302352 RepID=A0ABW2Z3I6_9SPHI